MDADCASSSNTNYTFNRFHPPQSYCFPKRSFGKKNVVLRSCQSTWFSKWRSKFWLRKLSDAISEHVFFKNFLGGMPQDPPSISMLRMLSVLCTLLFNSHTLGWTYQKLLPPPLECVTLLFFGSNQGRSQPSADGRHSILAPSRHSYNIRIIVKQKANDPMMG